MSTQVILSHWKRPENIQRIVERLILQTVPFNRIVIVDNSPKQDLTVSVESEELQDQMLDKSICLDIWRFPDNGYGPTCRFAPALINHTYEHTLFLDDDFLPGLNAHCTLLNAAKSTAKPWREQFATIGDIGRIYSKAEEGKSLGYHRDAGGDLKYVYKIKDVPRAPADLRVVDLTCRAHFVRTENVVHAINMRNKACGRSYQSLSRHDDILLCCGIQEATGYPSYILPKLDKEDSLISENLPEPHAMWQRSDHGATRTILINRCAKENNWSSQVKGE